MSEQDTGTALHRDAIGVAHIVFFVVAAAAPLAVVVGVTPFAFSAGNGAGLPLTFLLVGAMYVLFSVGFVAMSGRMRRAISFYPYISAGLGRAAGVGSALISIVSYVAVELMATALFGIFASGNAEQYLGIDSPWWAWSTLVALAVLPCGVRHVEFSGRVLGALLFAEVTILAILGLAILLAGGGPDGVVLRPFGAQALVSGNLSVGLVFVVSAFIGFEATCIFGEEAREPRKTIPLATYLAVIVIAGFYSFSTWVVALDYGAGRIAAAAGADPTHLYQASIERHLGKAVGVALQALMLTSTFACVLSFHNTVNRYLYVVSRERILPAWLARTHPRFRSPYVAGLVQSAGFIVAVLALGLGGAAPDSVVGLASAFSSVGILVIQILVSLAVVFYFRRNPQEVGAWRGLVAPALSAVTLSVCLYLMTSNLALLSGSDSAWVQAYPFLVGAIGLSGVLIAAWLRANKPHFYQQLGCLDV
jgi:amino acid transporter